MKPALITTGATRLALIPDFPAEQWPSMDLCAEMLGTHLHDSTSLCSSYRRIFAQLTSHRAAFNADRLLNRHFVYPRFLKRHYNRFDAFHIVDHSYSHLVHSLPAQRTGVFCHDLDAFRCLIEPQRDPRPRWFRAIARRILTGLQRAAVVFHSTAAVREEILRHSLLDASRLVHAPYGISPEFTPDTDGLLPPEITAPYLLHVGSNIPRKRIDVLLEVTAGVRKRRPNTILVKVGEPFNSAQKDQISRLGLTDAIMHFSNLDRLALATLYRHTALVLVPSEAEGFGLPVIEALACGALVVASDLPSLREAGGSAALYQSVGDVAAWTETICQVLEDSRVVPERDIRLAHAQQFSWTRHAATIRAAYLRLI